MFQPIHGTAPDLKDPNMANPTGAILSGALLFETLGFVDAGRALRAAVEAAIRQGHRTGDLVQLSERSPLSATDFEYYVRNAFERATAKGMEAIAIPGSGPWS